MTKPEPYVCIRVLIDGEHEQAVHVESVPLCDYEELQHEMARLRKIITNQRRELHRLNKYLGPYWAGFRKGLELEREVRLRSIMNDRFGHVAVHQAEVEAASRRHLEMSKPTPDTR